MDLNERFTDLADRVSTAIGRWPVTAGALLALVLWLALGPIMRFSDTWQLAANTPTTWIELFVGFLCAAAANRLERRNHEMQQAQVDTLMALQRQEEANARQEAAIMGLVAQVEALTARMAQDSTEVARDHSAMLHGTYLLVREMHAAQVPAPTTPSEAA